MDSYYTRSSALQYAISLGHQDAASLVSSAEAINAFLSAAPADMPNTVGLNSALGALGSTNAQQEKQEKTDAPKATRQRRTTASGATASETAPSTTATTATDQAANTAKSEPVVDKETDDLFGDAEPAKEEKKAAPKLTIENVKAALVSVQTALKGKDHALALLAKHTSPKGTKVLSALPESSWAALIAEADVAVKAGKVSA